MGKISPVAAKYIIHATIDIDGVVDRPDVIGAIFGQTEGLLGSDLELRELQRSGRIGRIEVNTDTRSGKTQGSIDIPSSLDKAETSIIAAALEIIQRIGPCTAKIQTKSIEDVRVSKRSFVIERAKELLRNLMSSSMPDSQELADEVAYSVRVMEVQEYGKERLPAGPAIDDSDEIIVVEGRADVLNLLKHAFKNVIAMNGTSVPETIVDLCKKKVVTVFVDGDRGGNLIIKEISSLTDIDFVTKAPDGKEVEEITKKEIHKALRSRVSGEQAKLESAKEETQPSHFGKRPQFFKPAARPSVRPTQFSRKPFASQEQKQKFKEMLENLIGTRGAQVLDQKLTTLGKVPISELATTIKSLNNAYAVIFDGIVDRDIAKAAEIANVKFLVGMDSKIRPNETRVSVLTVKEI
jgi:DNA primase|tara:strand:- start:2665 stop:3891 length:1227 start_codon:yes stop_codon:yes gene_type:complete